MKRLLNRGIISRIPSRLKSSNYGHIDLPSLTAPLSLVSLKAMVAATTTPRLTELDFPISPIPRNPLGGGKHIRTAAALIIGWVPVEISISWTQLRITKSDEILNGKVQDKNTQYFATFCFQQGIDL